MFSFLARVVLGSKPRPSHAALARPQKTLPPHNSLLEPLEGRQLLSAPVFDLEPLAVSQAPAAHAPAARTTRAAATLPGSTNSQGQTIKYSAPLVITKGGTYSGNWQSLSAKVPAIRIQTSQPVIIENSYIRSRSTCIEVYQDKAKVTIRNVHAFGLNPNLRSPNTRFGYAGRFLDVEGFSNMVVENNSFEGTSGMYFYNYEGNHTAAQSLKVRYNICTNIDGRPSNGKNGYLNATPNADYFRQFLQLNNNKNMVGVEIAWNQVVNKPGQSRVEENINIHNTTGTARSPIKIHDNIIHGAYPGAAKDKYDAGGGIMMSDNGSSYVRAYNNQIVGTTCVGITITSGHDNAFYNNRIISSGRFPDGRVLPYANVGAVIWNYNKEAGFKNNKAYNNLIGWLNNKGERNDSFAPDGSFKNNKPMAGAITLATETAEFTLWQKKLTDNNIQIGPKTA